ncbi:MAG: TetR/AcrR family transcriptional regulator C-terminal domain-containing protein [Brevundimonas sp.]|uniref:TetR/AcrR family transcriptional regulator C-terminal domain-containing protein n=1 Tax=Brevundimonas sp. TaxID=1871086 RepID=UPI00391DCD09
MTGTVNGGDDAGLRHKRRDILTVARRHFMAEGYAAARMEAIARDASVSTATLYAFFPSKTDLFTHVIDDASDDFARQIKGIRVRGDTVREQLVAFAETYAGFMGDPFVRAVFRLVMAERKRFQPTASGFFERGRAEIGGVLMQVIREHADKGALKVDRPSWAAGQLMGMIEHPVFFVPMVTGDDVQTRRGADSIATEAVDTFLARYGTGQG